ncbi:squalene--hopene cyclase [Geobacter sp. SVR]|uniref:squalene--hopene cyclase n=1 Tax=Geobacter sp. SVR TaxID=2495594 RepID=UPI00143F0521|nr:squalene--hopene cyclase [Geobacter sp. SVR]BCS52803.1 squalene--hopene cyclase [Geobacter sp. SVR]GCF86669.1 squalene--hopene cyclase [Geobacter sp. SVR]
MFSVIRGGKNHTSDTSGGGPDDARRESVTKSAALLLASRQKEDGHWVFDLEADATIPAEYVMLQRFIGRDLDSETASRLSAYLLERQLPDGGWPLYAVDGDANISASVKAYFALKLLGHDKHAPHMVKARQMILALGGAATCNVFTRITLALFGQVPWHTPPAMPIEIVLLPKWFFFHLSKIAYWSRTVIVPLLILYTKKPVCRLNHSEGIAELFTTPPDMLGHLDRFKHRIWRKNAFIVLDRFLKRTMHLMPAPVRRRALGEAEHWTRARMKGDGGIGAIYPAMANAVMALKTLGCSDTDPDYLRGIEAIDNLMIHRNPAVVSLPANDADAPFAGFDASSAAPELYPAAHLQTAGNLEFSFCQPCNSPVWDTCLSLSALAEAGHAGDACSAEAAIEWLFSQQITTPGDWSRKCPGLECGGWAFQYENALYPDVDDTSKVLMSLFRAGALERPEYGEKIARAVRWVLGMQSADGGWGAFDVDNNHLYLNDIPFADHGALLDPSTADLTGRCIEMLGMLGHGPDYPPIARGIAYLKKEQEEFGGWFGRWGVNYIYGTWSVLSGLHQAGEDMGSPYVRKAVDWLLSCQNSDGGWGETCASYDNPSLAGSGASTASQTAWALLALMAAGEAGHSAVQSGIGYLVQTYDNGWDEQHFTGTGFPRVFYLRYHGYSLFFPVWALGAYARQQHRGETVQNRVREQNTAKLRSMAEGA